MNKNLYRIVFNKARGMLMVVADIARSGRAGSSRSSGIGHTHSQLIGKVSALSFSLWLAMGAVQTAQANIVADAGAPKNQQPTVINSANGTPQVNIQTPSSAGVSRNNYTQFDVDQKGAILNNSHKNVQTNLGGMVAGNPWLAKGEAKVILNEVSSRDPSKLNGMIEVAGKKAQVVIANPSGITCSGCGFINANRATLTTGQPQMKDGALTGFNVERGEVVVDGAGMDTSGADYTDIIARSVKVNAGLWANDLKVTTGRNKVDAAHEVIEKGSDDPATRPQLAVDVASLGGMYAGKIRMVGTERGVGVRNAGAIGAQAGSVTISADGRIENSGTVRAAESASLQTAGELNNSGVITAASNVRANAASLTGSQQSVLAAGVKSDGTFADAGDLELSTSGQLSAHGQTLAGGNLSASGQGVDVSGGQAQGKRLLLDGGAGDVNTASAKVNASELTIRSGKLLNNSGGSLSAETINVSAHDLNNQKGKIVQRGSDALRVDLPGNLDNQQGQIGAANGVQLKAATLDNTAGQIVAVAGTTRLNADTLNNQQGLISAAAGDGEITSQQAVNNAKGRIEAAKTQRISAGSLNNQQGVIVADGATLALNGGEFDNRSGSLLSQGGLSVESGALNNQSGFLASDGDFSLRAGAVDNTDGQIGANQSLSASFDALSNDGGALKSVGAMTLSGGLLDNRHGTTFSGDSLSFNGGTLNNAAGQLAATDSVSLGTSQLINARGVLQGDGINVTTGSLDNASGTLNSLGALNLSADRLDNQAGTLAASGAADIAATELDNRNGGRIIGEADTALHTTDLQNGGGQIQSVGDLLLDSARGTVDNVSGLIRSGKSVTLNALNFVNHTTLGSNQGLEGQSLTLNTDTLDNQSGSILANHALNIDTRGVLNNSAGALASGETLSLSGDGLKLINAGGTLKAGENLSVEAASLDASGQLLSLGDMTLHSISGVNNSGTTLANGNLSFSTDGDLTNSGQLMAGSALNVQSANLNNLASGEINAGSTTLNTAGTLVNRGLIDGIATRINANTLTNTGTGRIYGDAVGINVDTFNNLAENGTAATLAGREHVSLGVQTLNNADHALIYSAGSMSIGGALDDNAAVTGRAGTINNHSSTIESAGDMAIAAGQINNINDRFSTEVVRVSEEELTDYQHSGSTNRWSSTENGVWVDDNSSDGLKNLNTPERSGHGNDNFNQYDYTRTIDETRIKESDPAKILAGGNLLLTGDKLFNDKSQVIAGGTLAIDQLGSVQNDDVTGQRFTTDDGTVTHYYRIRHKGDDEQGRDRTAYTPPTTIQSISLKPGQLVSNGSVEGSNLSITPLVLPGTDVAIGQAAGVTPAPQQTVSPGEPVTPPAGQQFEVTPADGAIRIIGPNTTLPDNSLFKVNPSAEVPYLVETDPRFTNERQWLGSDYMQDAFTTDGDMTQKRLGDGYYEQRLIREQVIGITGQRYLDGYNNDEEQYKALMDRGITFGKQYDLKIGVALTPAQMALLTGDIVWLVNTRVKMPDGSMENVLVPQVYAKVKAGDIDGSGALIAGNNVSIKLNGDLFNRGTIAGRKVLQIDADNITNQTGTIQGADVNLNARTDINNLGGAMVGDSSLLASAGRDINLTSTTTSASSVNGENSFARTTIDSVSGIYVQGDDGKLALQSGRDINLTGAQVIASGENGNAQLVAGRDMNLSTVQTASRDNLVWDADNSLKQGQTQTVGSEVTGKGDVTLAAGNDLNARAAALSAGQALNVSAGNNLTLTAGENTQDLDERHKVVGGNGFLSKTTTTTRDQIARQTVQSSELNGNTVNLTAGNDLTVRGSNVAGTGDVALLAGNNLSVETQAERNNELHQKQEKKSGLLSSGGIGFSVGTQSIKTTDTGADATQADSTLGSVNGDLTLRAGDRLTVSGSDLVAGQDMTLSGKNVDITAVNNRSQQTHEVEQKTSGLTLALSGTVGSALNSAVEASQQAKSSGSGRLQALQGVKAALSGVQAAQAARMDQAQGADAGNTNTVGISLSYGSQSSKSTQTSEQNTAQGSTLNAGRDLSVIATGSGERGVDGDLTVEGSQLKAGNDLTLAANRDLYLRSAQNTQLLDGKNESKGGSVGVGIGVGSGGFGLNISASVNRGKGNESGNGTTHSETTVDAGRQVNILTGRDATLTGAQVSGETVKADIGRNLTLTSEQDSDRYDSKQQNASAGGSFSIGSMTGSASVNLSRDKMHSNYDSVVEQTGIFAGKGGYDVTVGEHTQLNGAVIGSTATADKNRLDTGTIGFSDIENRADFEVEHQSVGMSTGGSIGSQFAGNMANGLLVGANRDGHDSSTTHAAVSDGTLIIRNQDRQVQDVNQLSRDVEHANQTLSPIFDKEKEQERLQQAQLIGEIGNQVADIARTEGSIRATNAAKEKLKNVNAQDLLEAKAAWEKANPGKTATLEDINGQIYQTTYNDALSASGFGTGGQYQQAIQAATAAVQGLAGSDLSAALAGGAAPYVAEVIGHYSGLNDAGKVAAHAVVNAALAAAQGQDALAGAAGAATGELVGMIATEMYGKSADELDETQKQTVSALATLAAGLSGGLVGDSSASAVSGAQAGKTTVENNYLSTAEARQLDAELAECKASGGDCKSVVQKYLDISNKNSKELVEACTGGGVTCVTWEELLQASTNVANDPQPGQFRLDEKLKDPDAAAIVNYLNRSDLKFLKDNITQGDRVLSVVMDPTSWPVVVMGGKAILTNALNNTKEQLIAVGVGVGLGAGIQYGTTGEVKLSDLISSGLIGGITAGKGYNPTVTWNAAGAYYQAEINGDDPFISALLSKAGASAGYATGNLIKIPMDKILNPVSKQYEWVPTGVWTITKPVPQSSVPSIMGNLGDSYISGVTGDALKKKESGKENAAK
ncbi:filamentous hemagglutinin N-terminal domain-containing protein [Enterobacter sp. MF024]|uniref:two-partner secretion domain-containing protein n=1 Tax=Enterobacter sp. MF024 TaxID=2555644 RepID=UPI001107171B|nr:hemagglutinin repeat-containing protein [Enterobacter sp. MF024]TLU65640.1 filamentous hemagglutinin N-terminal domain-containing protein [Enterobacter sp. MF024]